MYQLHQATARREGLILAQLELLKTRQEAIEVALRGSGLADRLRWAIDPNKLMARVDTIQQGLIDQSKKDLDAAIARQRIVTPAHA